MIESVPNGLRIYGLRNLVRQSSGYRPVELTSDDGRPVLVTRTRE